MAKAAASPTTTRRDPFPVFCFWVTFVQLKDIDKTFFRSVSGLRSEHEVIPVRAGGANEQTFNLMGPIKWSPLVLKQGFSSSMKLLEWREKWISAPTKKPPRTDGAIIQLDTQMNPVASWEFKNAWPSKWELGDYDASKSELQIETLELVHEGLRYAPMGGAKKK